MTLNSITALSPVDGRYANSVNNLRPYLSEFALIRYRVLIEVRWLQWLADEPSLTEIGPLPSLVKDLLNQICDDFDVEAAERIKSIEKTTNHDVKACEYYLKEKLKDISEVSNIYEFFHFACTSEDINNLAYAMMLRNARDTVLNNSMRSLENELGSLASRYAETPMLARTHGQSASPTTVGKEFRNVTARLKRQRQAFRDVEVLGKFNGAVGSFAAHHVAYPDTDWPSVAQAFVESLGLNYNPLTTQIEPHDWIAEYCHSLSRFNVVLIDLSRDIWGYISLGYFRQRPVEGEVGSSTMPHKVNPIDFENAEGNLGVANALLGFFAGKLPISRWQRDLTDSTVLRNLGVALAHSQIALSALQRGLGKLDIDENRLAADLDQNWEVLAEAIQTVMRRYGLPEPYEQLKQLTRGQRITPDTLQSFVNQLDLPPNVKAELAQLTPAGYIGLAAKLARTS